MGEESSLFELIEKKLDQALLPVNPEEKYISTLNTRLFIQPRISIERDSTIKIILFLCLAFITGFTFVLLFNEIFAHGSKKKAI
jgi:hypothetical protein